MVGSAEVRGRERPVRKGTSGPTMQELAKPQVGNEWQVERISHMEIWVAIWDYELHTVKLDDHRKISGK